MGKLKTNRSAAKRFSVTKTGKVKHKKAYLRHLLSSKSRARKRHLRQRRHPEHGRRPQYAQTGPVPVAMRR